MTSQSTRVSVISRVTSAVTRARRESAPDRPHLIERAAAARAIGEQDEISIARRIDPQRRAGEADVAERRRRHLRAARRSRQHRIPAERARASGNRALRGEAARPARRPRRGDRGVAARGAQDRARERADAARRCRTARHDRQRRREPPRSCREPRRRASRPRRTSSSSAASAPRSRDRPEPKRTSVTVRVSASRAGAPRRGEFAEQSVERPSAPRSATRKPSRMNPRSLYDGSRARRVFERHRADVVLELSPPSRRRVEQPRRQPGGVLEQVAHRHAVTIAAPPFGERIRHRLSSASRRVARVPSPSSSSRSAFVSDARSNGVWSVTSCRSRTSSCQGIGPERSPLDPTSTAAAGNTRCAIAIARWSAPRSHSRISTRSTQLGPLTPADRRDAYPVPVTTYHVHASGVNSRTPSIASARRRFRSLTPLSVARSVSTPSRNAPSIGP